MWPSISLCLLGVLSVSAFSKYGRSCKDIGCLNSESCVMAEEPCSYGRTSECGSYPTCKKKSATELSNNPAPAPAVPKPIAPIRPAQNPSGYDDVPNYAPPPPPRGGSSGGYGGGSSGGYGGSSGGYGGSNGGYGGSNGGYGGASGGYGGSNGGYGGASGGYGGSNGGYGGSSGGYRGGSSGGTNGGGLFGNTNGGAGGGSSGFPDSLGNLFGNNGLGGLFGNGAAGTGGTAGNKDGSNPISSILSNILSNFTKGGSLPNLSTLTRPGLIENTNNNPNPYGSNTYGYIDPNAGYNNQRQGIYPSLNNQAPGNTQGQQTQQNGYVAKNYGSANANARSSAYTTRRSVSYGYSLGHKMASLNYPSEKEQRSLNSLLAEFEDEQSDLKSFSDDNDGEFDSDKDYGPSN